MRINRLKKINDIKFFLQNFNEDMKSFEKISKFQNEMNNDKLISNIFGYHFDHIDNYLYDNLEWYNEDHSIIIYNLLKDKKEDKLISYIEYLTIE